VADVKEDGYAESLGVQVGAKVVAIGGYKVENRADVERQMDRCIYESTSDSPNAVVRMTPVCTMRVDELLGLTLGPGGVVHAVEPGGQGDTWGILPGSKLVSIGMEDVAGWVKRMYERTGEKVTPLNVIRMEWRRKREELQKCLAGECADCKDKGKGGSACGKPFCTVSYVKPMVSL
jgi:predicted metalloprotease with PDZ domain